MYAITSTPYRRAYHDIGGYRDVIIPHANLTIRIDCVGGYHAGGGDQVSVSFGATDCRLKYPIALGPVMWDADADTLMQWILDHSIHGDRGHLGNQLEVARQIRAIGLG